ncbi:MAG: calcium-translocating P-type ATPase, PMCA-type [Bacteroidales bacterium]|nr:calcium-translocating P-type ATPase, PMCA-type [Bacteroidales bacterium]
MHGNLKGLSTAQVLESRSLHGENILTPPPRSPWWQLLFQKFNDPIIRILSVAATIAIVLGIFNGHYLEGIGIVLAILLATFMSFINEFRAGKEFDILNQVNDDMPVKVIREGNVTSIPKRDIVVGDIVIIDRGDEIPSDGVLLESVSLTVNESSLTGEPVTSKNSDLTTDDGSHTYPVNRVYKSTVVVEGNGLLETTAVGDKTEIGTTARESTIVIDAPTPLTLQLHKLSDFISSSAFILAILIFAILAFVDISGNSIGINSNQKFVFGATVLAIVGVLAKFWLPSINYLLSAAGIKLRLPNVFEIFKINALVTSAVFGLVVLVVAAVVGYFTGVNFLLPQNWFSVDVLSRLLNYFMVSMTLIVVAVPEGLAMSVTLSLAYSMRKMTAANNLVRRMQATETMGAATVICTDKTGTLTQNQMNVIEWHFIGEIDVRSAGFDADVLKYSLAVNSSAHLDYSEVKVKTVGNPTDASLLLWLDKNGIGYQDLRSSFAIERQVPFSSESKYMFTIGTDRNNRRLMLVKGAPEIVLAMSNADDGIAQISKQIIEEYQSKSLRAIAFAYRDLGLEPVDLEAKPSNLKFLGFVGIADPVRPDVAQAVASCHTAGIDVKMVTGDNVVTASSIGRQINILSESSNHGVISGPDFEALPDAEAAKIVSDLKIMYRARPSDKLKLVRLLQESGQVVAVTGDGTNDAPSLNRANVGLAMGTGTQVAKEASDIILLDDSFASIVSAVRWGRTLFQNIQKFLFFQLTINLLAVAIVIVGPFTGITLPLTVPQMLWVNLIMDTFAALALATEPPYAGVMLQHPRKPDDFIISKSIRNGIVYTAAIFFVVLVALLRYMQSDGDVSRYELTLFFNIFVMLQFWNLFNARVYGQNVSVFKGLFKNKSFLLIAFAIVVGQIAIVELGGAFFRTVPLKITDWLLVIFLTSLILWFAELFRLVSRLLTNTK